MERAGRAPWTREIPWIALVVCGAMAPLVALLASGHAIAYFDSARLFAPMRVLVAQALRSGRLPLWNPYEGTGMPLFAQGIHGVLHPWSLLAALVTADAGVDVMIVLHVVTGALGAGVLARTMGATRSAAAVAGVGYGLSGYLLSMSRVLTFLAGAGAAPWVIAGLLWAAQGRRFRIPVAAIAVTVAHLAGDPQWAVLSTAAGILLAWHAGGWRGAGRAVVAALAGTMLAAVQLVPAWSFYERSARRVGLDAPERLQWALSPWRLPELVAPGFFAGRPGALAAPVFQWLGGTSRYPLPFVYSVAVGAPVLFLAIAGSARGRAARIVAAAALMLLWLALGYHLGASDAVGWVPVWRGLRYSEKLVGPLTLAIAVLAAAGADSLARGYEARTVRVAAACAAVAGLVSAGALIFARGAPPAGAPEPAWRLAGEQLSRGMVHAALGLAGTAAVLWAARRWDGWRSRLGSALAGIVLIQGLAAAPFALHAGRRELRDPAPLAALRAREAVPRVITPLEAGTLSLPAGLDELDGSLYVQSRMGAVPYTVASGVDQLNTYTGVEPARLSALFRTLIALGPGQLVALRRFSVTHVVVPAEGAPGDESIAAAATVGGRRIGVDAEARLEVWAVPHRPWASFADRVRLVPGEAEAGRALVDLEAAGDPAVVLLGRSPPALSPGVVLAVDRAPESVRVLAESSAEGLLVVNDADWPGWEATIDGRKVDIQLADGLVRAVRWPPGRHVLQMAYRPVELTVGIAASVAGLLLCLALGFRDAQRWARDR